MAIILFLGFICQIINYLHLSNGRAQKGDLGYFWRLWQSGHRDGKIMIYLTFICLLIAFILCISIILVGING